MVTCVRPVFDPSTIGFYDPPRKIVERTYMGIYPELFSGELDMIAIRCGGDGARQGYFQLIADNRGNQLSINPHESYRVKGRPRLGSIWLLCDDTFRTGETARACAEKLVQAGYDPEKGYIYSAFDLVIRRVSDIFYEPPTESYPL